MINRLLDGGYAYAAAGHVLFDVTSYARYGELSGRTIDELIAGARVEVAPFKRHPGDFVLWKPSEPTLPGWDSPWGRGRPGWHIECSAMAEQHLGESIDIHGGGNDLKFPHHENEIAQSVCAHGGRPFARYWVHNGFVEIDSEKMSKSLGNVLLVEDLLADYPGEAIRLALLNARYREPLNWNDDLLAQAKARLDRLYGALQRLEAVEVEIDDAARPAEKFQAAMDDDLNSALAIASLMECAGVANSATDETILRDAKRDLLTAGAELGILQQRPEDWFSGHSIGVDVERIEAMIAERQAARDEKNWARADAIRDELAAMGVQIQDSTDGTQWRV